MIGTVIDSDFCLTFSTLKSHLLFAQKLFYLAVQLVSINKNDTYAKFTHSQEEIFSMNHNKNQEIIKSERSIISIIDFFPHRD